MLLGVVAAADAAGVKGGSLGSHARHFSRHLTPWAIGGLVVAFVVARATLGPPRWSDLVVAAAFLALEPLI